MDEVNDGSVAPVDTSAEVMDPVSGESMNSGDGNLSTQMSPAQIDAILARPASHESLGTDAPKNGVLNDEDLGALTKEYDRQQKYGDRPIAATAAALASGLTFSLSDRIAPKLGITDKETLAGLAEYNPGPDIVGQVGGAIIPALLTAGASIPESAAEVGLGQTLKQAARGASRFMPGALAETAGSATEKAALKAFGTAATESGNKKLVAEIVKKSIAKGAGSAVEGAAWGANQLLREDAIGKAELNAENLLSYAGEGALVGGGLGAALVPGGAILKGIGGGLSKGLQKVGATLFDPVKDAAKLMDLTPSQMAKFEAKNPKFLEQLPDWIKNKLSLKLTDSAESLVTKLDNVQTAAAEGIDNTVLKLDQKLADSGASIGGGIYDDVAKQLQKDFVEPYAGLRSMESHTAKAEMLVEDFKTLAAKHRLEGTPVTFEALRDMRIKMDKLAKQVYKSLEPSEGAQAAYAARSAFNDVMKKYAGQVDPKLAEEFAAHNLDYHIATTLRPRLGIKAEKASNFVGFKDLLLGSIGAELGGAWGTTAAMANRLMNSDLKRKMVILSQVERAAQNAASKTAEAMEHFFTKAARPAKLASTGILVRSALGRKPGSDEAPKNRAAAYTNILNNVASLAADPQKLQDRIAKSTHILGYAAPQTASSMGDTMVRATKFLARKMPKDARDSNYNQFEQPYEPSSVELSKFERYMQVVEHPLSVLSDLKSGALTRDHVEALKAVYPNLYNEMRVAALKQAQSQDTLSYPKRIQLGILLDIPTDASLSPQFIMQMQQNFVPPEQRQDQMQANGVPQSGPAVKPTQSGAAAIDKGSRAQTSTQRVVAGGAGS